MEPMISSLVFITNVLNSLWYQQYLYSFLFFYGYCTNQYCYDPQYGNHYHCLLHGISSLGHHGILLLN